MALLTAQPLAVGGVTPTYASAAAGGDQAPIGRNFLLEIRNGGASPITATLVTYATFKGIAVADTALVIPAGGIGLVPMDTVYRNPANGQATVTYSAVTSVTVAVLQTA
jgi:hypothetical protein